MAFLSDALARPSAIASTRRTCPPPCRRGNLFGRFRPVGLVWTHVVSRSLSRFVQLPMLDPFVTLCVSCLQLSPSANVHALALRVCMCLLRVPALPSLQQPTHVNSIGAFVFRALQGQASTTGSGNAATGNAAGELVQASFAAMAALVRRFDAFRLEDAQMRVLIALVQEDMENYKKQSQAFSVPFPLLGTQHDTIHYACDHFSSRF